MIFLKYMKKFMVFGLKHLSEGKREQGISGITHINSKKNGILE
jgi:hypothetical protein